LETGRRITITDVARHAGVSVGTVSNVLNGTRPVSPDRHDAVMGAVAALGYRPDGVARTLVARRRRRPRAAGTPRPRLVVAGYLSVDYVLDLDRVPQDGARVTARQIRKMLGEPCAVDVDLVTRVGTDDDSLWAIAALAERGVDAGLAGCAPGGALSRCVVMVDAEGTRTIVNEPSPVTADDLAAVLLGAVSAAPASVHFDVFHVAAGRALAPALRAAGCRISVHGAGLDAGAADLDDLLAFDIVFLDRDARAALGAPSLARLQAALDRGGGACEALALTAGAGTARLLRPHRTPVAVEPPAMPVVDTTGAGDAFAGVFLAARLAGMDAKAAFRSAVAGASLSVTALGAQGRIVTSAELGRAGAARPEEAGV